MLIIIVKTSYSNYLTLSLKMKKLIFAKIRPGKSSVPLFKKFQIFQTFHHFFLFLEHYVMGRKRVQWTWFTVVGYVFIPLHKWTIYESMFWKLPNILEVCNLFWFHEFLFIYFICNNKSNKYYIFWFHEIFFSPKFRIHVPMFVVWVSV